MKKRLRKKLAKKAVAHIPKGYGQIIGNKWSGSGAFHHFKIGTIVRIHGVGRRIITCEDSRGVNQGVFREHIVINN